MSKRLTVLLGAVVLLVCAAPRGAHSATEILSLNEALNIAFEHNPRMARARQAIAGSRAGLSVARTWPSPEIEAEIGGLRSSEDGSRKANLDTLTVKQPLGTPGVRRLESAIAENAIALNEQSLQEVWSGIYRDVRRTYKELVLNGKELELRRKNLQSMRQFYSDVQVRYQGGQALKNHVQRARIELLKTESEYLQTENAGEVARARLNMLLGRSRETPVTVENTLEEEQLTLDLQALTRTALANRPDIQRELTLLDSHRKKVALERLRRLPYVALGFQMIDEEYEEDYAVVLEMSLPLWNFSGNRVRRAKAERASQELALAAKEHEISFDVYAAYKDARLASEQLELYKQSLVEATEMLRLATLEYGEGHIDFLNYLDQLSASLETRLQYYRGLFRLSQSISELEGAIHSSLREEEFFR